MFSCFKKFYVIFLSFSFMSSANAMENSESTANWLGLAVHAAPVMTGFAIHAGRQIYNQRVLNSEFWNAIRAAHRNNPDNYSPVDLANIGHCLDKGADPNAYYNYETPLSFAAFTKNVGFIDFLIKHGADVNHKNSFFSPYYTPLDVAAGYSWSGNYEKLKLLCDAGASLTDAVKYPWSYGNIFHRAFFCKGTIETLIMHGRFNSEKAIINQGQQEKLITIISELEKWNPKGYGTLPAEIQDHIISYLPLEYFQDPDSELCCRLKKYENPLIFGHINKRVAWIKKLLKSSSLVRGAALDYMLTARYLIDSQKKELTPLLDGSEIDEHYRRFSEEFPKMDPANWITIMYGNCARLELKK